MNIITNIHSPLIYKQQKIDIIIRDIKKGDGKEITELFKENYGDTYYEKNFYNPQFWEGTITSKKYYPVVAEFENRVVGQFLLKLNDKYNGEILAVVVHPDFKGRGIMNNMFDYIIQKARNLGLYAIYGEAIMFHPYSQKANLKHGMIQSALQLGEVASFIAQKNIKFEKRTATLVSYKILRNTPKSLYFPKIYEKIIKERYKKAKIKLKKINVKPQKNSLNLWEKKLLKIAGIVIEGKVKNFKNRFNFLFSKAKINTDMIYADINLKTKEIDEIVEFLNKKKFFYSGVLFYRYHGDDYLRLQFENTPNVEERYNVCYSDYCKFLSRSVIKDKKRVRRS